MKPQPAREPVFEGQSQTACQAVSPMDEPATKPPPRSATTANVGSAPLTLKTTSGTSADSNWEMKAAKASSSRQTKSKLSAAEISVCSSA